MCFSTVKANCIMAYITSSTANRLREAIAMYLALVRLHPAYFASYCLCPQCNLKRV